MARRIFDRWRQRAWLVLLSGLICGLAVGLILAVAAPGFAQNHYPGFSWPAKVTAGLDTAGLPHAVQVDTSGVLQVNSSGAGTSNVNVKQIGGTAVVTGGVNGLLAVGGAAASGAATSGNPVMCGGSDGTNARFFSTDTSGRLNTNQQQILGTNIVTAGVNGLQAVGGAAANGAATSGNPVLVAGSDGANARSISTNASGQVNVVFGTPQTVTPGTSNLTTTINALNGTAVLTTIYPGSKVYIHGGNGGGLTGNWNGTLTFQATTDNFVYNTIQVVQLCSGTAGTCTVTSPPTQVTTYACAGTNCVGEFLINAAGVFAFQVQATAWTSGPVTISYQTTWDVPTMPVTQAAAPWTINTTQISGSAITTAAAGTQQVGIVGNAGAAFDAAGQNVVSPANEILVGAQFNTTPTTIVSGRMSPLQLDSAGNLLTDTNRVGGSVVATAASGTQKVGIVGNAGAAFDAAGQNVASPANEVLIGGQFNTTPTTIVSGNMSPLQLDSAGNLLTDLNRVGGNAVATAASGTQKVGIVGNASDTMDAKGQNQPSPSAELIVGGNYNSAPSAITSGNVSPLQMDSVGSLRVAQQASTSGGSTSVKIRNLGAVTSVKASAGTLYAVEIVNTIAATEFIQIFNVASGSVTLGTTTPDLEFQVGANASVSFTLPTMGVSMVTAISIASTTAEAGAGATGPGLMAFVQYQ